MKVLTGHAWEQNRIFGYITVIIVALVGIFIAVSVGAFLCRYLTINLLIGS